MDKNKYGEIIVNQIINAYKNSEEFTRDASDFMRNWLTSIINAKTAQAGDTFVLETSGGKTITEEAQNEFMSRMSKYKELKTKLDDLYELLNDEVAETFRPIFFKQ